MVFNLFASSDGLHNSGGLNDVEEQLDVIVVPSGNGIQVALPDRMKLIDGTTGTNENNTAYSTFTIKTVETLQNPSFWDEKQLYPHINEMIEFPAVTLIAPEYWLAEQKKNVDFSTIK